jgi:hypothetical protein
LLARPCRFAEDGHVPTSIAKRDNGAGLYSRAIPAFRVGISALSYLLTLNGQLKQTLIAHITDTNHEVAQTKSDYPSSGCSRKNRSISLVASGPRGSVKEPAGLPPDHAWPAP